MCIKNPVRAASVEVDWLVKFEWPRGTCRRGRVKTKTDGQIVVVFNTATNHIHVTLSPDTLVQVLKARHGEV